MKDSLRKWFTNAITSKIYAEILYNDGLFVVGNSNYAQSGKFTCSNFQIYLSMVANGSCQLCLQGEVNIYCNWSRKINVINQPEGKEANENSRT